MKSPGSGSTYDPIQGNRARKASLCRCEGNACFIGFKALDAMSESTCNPKNLQFYGFYLLIKGYLLLNCRLLEPQVGLRV